MAITIAPKRTLLGDLATGLAAFSGGYGKGYGGHSGEIAQVGQQHIQSIANPIQQATSQAYQQYSALAYQQNQFDQQTKLQNQSHANAMERMNAEQRNSVNRWFLQNYGAPLTDDFMGGVAGGSDGGGSCGPGGCTPPSAGGMSVGGGSPIKSLTAQYAELPGVKPGFGDWLSSQQQQKEIETYRKKQEALNLEWRVPDDSDTKSLIAKIDKDLQSAEQSGQYDPETLAWFRQDAQAQKDEILKPQWLPKRPKPQTFQEAVQQGVVVPMPNGVDYMVLDNKSGSYKLNRGTPPKPEGGAGAKGGKTNFYDRFLSPSADNVGPPIAAAGPGPIGQPVMAGAPQIATSQPATSQPANVASNLLGMFKTSEGDLDYVVDQNGQLHADDKRAKLDLERRKMAIEAGLKAGVVKTDSLEGSKTEFDPKLAKQAADWVREFLSSDGEMDLTTKETTKGETQKPVKPLPADLSNLDVGTVYMFTVGGVAAPAEYLGNDKWKRQY